MIETVLGPVPAASLGSVSTNEHLLTDSTGLLRPNREGRVLDGPIRPEILGDLRWSWLSLRDNLALDDPDAASEELARANDAGVDTVVEATSWGMGPRHAALPEISRRSGVQIVAAYGGYIDKTLPAWWRELDEGGLEELFRSALTVAVPDTSYRAGLLGLLGTSAEITPAESRTLRAAGRIAADTGSAVSIRLDAAARRGPEVANVLTGQGMTARRILFCNIDKVLDPAYIAEVSGTGAVVEFAFGSENHFADRARDAADDDRIEALCALLDAHPDARVTLSCSVWTKGQLTRHGGMGYAHVVRRIVPALERAGIAPDRIRRMLVTEPADLLDRP